VGLLAGLLAAVAGMLVDMVGVVGMLWRRRMKAGVRH